MSHIKYIIYSSPYIVYSVMHAYVCIRLKKHMDKLQLRFFYRLMFPRMGWSDVTSWVSLIPGVWAL